ncbi:DUF3857 domain-containing protein [Arachidicoccus sp.]|uniref:DUF3857 domain-containing protein n=1 Tax=Arachidicoccus sp. TaxID=1872624 RepID=UPI003D23645E
MRKILYTIALLFACTFINAQEKLIKFGKPDPKELELKDCDFDKGAPIYCLADVGVVRYNINENSVNIETDRRRKFIVFKESGIANADVKISYQSKDGYESIVNIKGYVYNKDPDGKITITELSRKDIYNKVIDENTSEISFAMPNVKVGSVFEYEYKLYKKTYSNINSWYFQHSYPVKYSAYNLIIPSYFDFKYQIIRRQDITVKNSSYADGNWYIMHNIPSLQGEPYMAAVNDFLQRVDFNLTTFNPPGEAPVHIGETWDNITDGFLKYNDLGGQLSKNVKHPEELDNIVSACKTDLEKTKAIYDYVQKNMNWNGDYEMGSLQKGGIKAAWDKKQGSTADINLLLLNLLRDYKIKASPLLVSTRDNGSIYVTYPSMDAFNATMVYVRVDSTNYVLNAADKYNPFGQVPYEVQFTKGLICDKAHSGWVNIFDISKKLRTAETLVLNIDKSGKIFGNGEMDYFDYAKNQNLKRYKDNKLKSFLSTAKGITLQVDSLEVKDENDEKGPLEVKVDYSGGVRSTGDYLLVPYNLFSGMTSNPFTAENRQTSIDFGFLQSYTITGYINFADNFTLEGMPKNIIMRNLDSSILIKRIFQKLGDSSIAFRLNIDFLRPIYSREEYPDIKAFYKQLFKLLDEQIVLKRKNNLATRK